MTDEKKNKYLVNLNEVDQNIKTFVEIKARPRGDDGERLINDKGEFTQVKIISAKENGSYRGRILANKEGLLIQAAGKKEQFAIVHNKEQVDIQGANLKKLNREEALGDSSVQIHYKKDQAKMYPWNQKEHEAAIDKKITEQKATDAAMKSAKPSGQKATVFKVSGIDSVKFAIVPDEIKFGESFLVGNSIEKVKQELIWTEKKDPNFFEVKSFGVANSIRDSDKSISKEQRITAEMASSIKVEYAFKKVDVSSKAHIEALNAPQPRSSEYEYRKKISLHRTN